MWSNPSMIELEYVVLKINDQDLSKITHNEAIGMFLSAEETIVVEMRRRRESTYQDNISAELDTLKISNVTKLLANDKCSTSSKITCSLPHLPPAHEEIIEKEVILTLHQNNIQTTSTSGLYKGNSYFLSAATQTEDEKLYLFNHSKNFTRDVSVDNAIEQEHHLFEQCLEPEIDIEEITLCKVNSKEEVGITVCHAGSSCANATASGSNNDNNNGALSYSVGDFEAAADVIISEIQLNSIAGRDGRLREGDQILQINGRNIKNKDDAATLIAENNNEVTLLVSRYLYTDEDNDDYDEYYEDNNMEYANCFFQNDNTSVDELDKVLYAQAEIRKQITQSISTNESNVCTNTCIKPSEQNATIANPSSSCILDVTNRHTNLLLNSNSLSDPLDKQFKSCTAIDADIVAFLLQQKTATTVSKADSKKSSTIIKSLEYDESEHIYETIPEDSESEPFYCSPYESATYMTAVGSCSSATTSDVLELQQQKYRVAQWLGIKSHPIGDIATRNNISATGDFRQTMRNRNNLSRNLNKINTARSAITNVTSGSSSSGGAPINIESVIRDDMETFSSTYNTSGSNNSATPLTLMLNKINHGGVNIDDLVLAKAHSTSANVQRVISAKEHSVTSPKSSMLILSKITQNNTNYSSDLREKAPQKSIAVNELLHSNISKNAFNQSTILQHFPRNAIITHQKLSEQHCPQFTAPNLSQYHFVSSQEVSTVKLYSTDTALPSTQDQLVVPVAQKKNQSDETTMVWKVKRRPDGTRYIVRRPARHRGVLINVRKSVRNNDTTTEDDTISEVKIGRYWSKEDRKRHFERARDRRLQQLQQQQL